MLYSISRDYGIPSLVRIVTDDAIEAIIATGWLGLQTSDIDRVNNGPFEWSLEDSVLLTIINPVTASVNPGAAKYVNLFSVFPDLQSLNPITTIIPNLQNVVAHAGGGQALAYPLNLGINVVTVVATAGDSVLLPANVVGQTVIVTNTGANSLNIFPFLGDNINNLGINVPYPLAPQATAEFLGVDNSDWRTTASGGYASTQGLTAHSGGGQASATQLNIGVNVVTVVVTTNDSVVLPTTVLGKTVIVQNAGGAALNVFPAVGNSINQLGANVAIQMIINSRAIFIGTQPTAWVSIIQSG